MNAGFDEAEIERLFAALASSRGALLAVSGGPDSAALMHLAARWTQRHAVPVFVASVDHGLRPQSRAEAERVAGWAEVLGLPNAILTWEGEKPKARIQERARAARYDLLLRHARCLDADHLITAHHADDQAETILFRLVRGSGLGGLAGMQASTQLGEMTHLRPLLQIPKAALVAYCAAVAQPFLLDPSNENPAFARTRLRRLAPLLAEEGLDRPALLRLGERARRADEALEDCVKTLRARLPAMRSQTQFLGNIDQLIGMPEEILIRFLEREIRELCPARPLRLNRLEALAGSLATALAAGQSLQATLAGALIALDPAGNLSIRPEGQRRRGFCSVAGNDARPTASDA